MDLELGNVRKPVRQLKKALKSLRGDPPIELVHDLRTRARRIEAIAGMLLSNQENSKRRLLKVLKPLRKVAGEVRDFDVLAAKARALARHCRNDSAARLLEHLQVMRVESAHMLVDAVAERRQDACDSLKQFSIEIEKRLERLISGSTRYAGTRKPHTDAAIRLMNDLSDWPPFSTANLHTFRIKVKELRYILQLTDAADPKFVTTLERAKARIGDWHDWQEFRKIAREVLHERKDRPLLEEMEQTESKKLKQALAAAQPLRTRYLGAYRGFTIAEP